MSDFLFDPEHIDLAGLPGAGPLRDAGIKPTRSDLAFFAGEYRPEVAGFARDLIEGRRTESEIAEDALGLVFGGRRPASGKGAGGFGGAALGAGIGRHNITGRGPDPSRPPVAVPGVPGFGVSDGDRALRQASLKVRPGDSLADVAARHATAAVRGLRPAGRTGTDGISTASGAVVRSATPNGHLAKPARPAGVAPVAGTVRKPPSGAARSGGVKRPLLTAPAIRAKQNRAARRNARAAAEAQANAAIAGLLRNADRLITRLFEGVGRGTGNDTETFNRTMDTAGEALAGLLGSRLTPLTGRSPRDNAAAIASPLAKTCATCKRKNAKRVAKAVIAESEGDKALRRESAAVRADDGRTPQATRHDGLVVSQPTPVPESAGDKALKRESNAIDAADPEKIAAGVRADRVARLKALATGDVATLIEQIRRREEVLVRAGNRADYKRRRSLILQQQDRLVIDAARRAGLKPNAFRRLRGFLRRHTDATAGANHVAAFNRWVLGASVEEETSRATREAVNKSWATFRQNKPNATHAEKLAALADLAGRTGLLPDGALKVFRTQHGAGADGGSRDARRVRTAHRQGYRRDRQGEPTSGEKIVYPRAVALRRRHSGSGARSRADGRSDAAASPRFGARRQNVCRGHAPAGPGRPRRGQRVHRGHGGLPGRRRQLRAFSYWARQQGARLRQRLVQDEAPRLGGDRGGHRAPEPDAGRTPAGRRRPVPVRRHYRHRRRSESRRKADCQRQ